MKASDRSLSTNLHCEDKLLSQGEIFSDASKKGTGFLQQSLFYLPALIIPGLVNFIALSVYTRLLSADEYGKYAFFLAIMVNVKIVGFEWLKLGLFRYYQRAEQRGHLAGLLFTILIGFVIVSLIISILWIFIISLISVDNLGLSSVLKLGLPFMIVYALFEMILQMNRAAIFPLRYGALSSIRALLCLGAATLFILLCQKDAYNLLLGIIIGTILPVIAEISRWISKIKKGSFEIGIAFDLLRYGMPLALVSGIGLIISTSDRILIKYFIGAEALGLYAAGYDLADQTLMTIFMVMNLAVYPLILKTAENSGNEAAGVQMQKYAVFLIGCTLPVVVLIVNAAQPFADVALGEAFRQSAGEIIPWVILATFLLCLKAFFFDLAFQISFRTDLQIWSTVAAAVVNVTLNLWWIPLLGLMGAVYASVSSHAIALVISIVLGRRVFAISIPLGEIGKITAAASLMALTMLVFSSNGWITVCIKIAAAGIIYMLTVWILNVANSRKLLKQALHRVTNRFQREPV